MVLRSKSVYILKTLNALLKVLKKINSLWTKNNTYSKPNKRKMYDEMLYKDKNIIFSLFYFIFLTAVFLKGHGKKFVAKLKKISEARSQFYYSVANVNTPCNPHWAKLLCMTPNLTFYRNIRLITNKIQFLSNLIHQFYLKK